MLVSLASGSGFGLQMGLLYPGRCGQLLVTSEVTQPTFLRSPTRGERFTYQAYHARVIIQRSLHFAYSATGTGSSHSVEDVFFSFWVFFLVLVLFPFFLSFSLPLPPPPPAKVLLLLPPSHSLSLLLLLLLLLLLQEPN